MTTWPTNQILATTVAVAVSLCAADSLHAQNAGPAAATGGDGRRDGSPESGASQTRLDKDNQNKQLTSKEIPETLSISNTLLDLTLDTADATLSVKDLRTGKIWQQKAVSENAMVVKASQCRGNMDLELLVPTGDLIVKGTISLDEDKPELILSLVADGDLPQPLRFPHPFVTDKGTYLVVPINEGISYPVDDETIKPRHLIAYGGHGLCMAFFGATDGEQGYLGILETSDDASIQIDRADGRLYIAPAWDAQKGTLRVRAEAALCVSRQRRARGHV